MLALENTFRSTAHDDIKLRLYDAGAHRLDRWAVQKIINLGVHDKRLNPAKRERREILGRFKTRAEAVSLFNSVMIYLKEVNT